MVSEHQINTKEDCSEVWTSKFGLALCACSPLQLRSNISERLLVAYHRLITLIFMWVNWRNLLPIHRLHVLSLVKFFSLSRPRYCRFWFFLLFSSWAALNCSYVPNKSIFRRLRCWGMGFELFFSRWIVLPLRSVQCSMSEQSYMSSLLTWNERNHIESVPPIVWNLNCLFGYGVVRNRITLLVGMVHKSV